MDQHPVPRNITGFQFQLIGSMTVKQFGYLLTGLILAFVFFKLPLWIFRFPLALIWGFLGFALAFLPIQERPLDIWIVNFIKSMYAPTQFVWRKEDVIPDFLKIAFIPSTLKTTTQSMQHYDARKKLETYLQTIAPKEYQLLDAWEQKALQNLIARFHEPQATSFPIGQSLLRTPFKPVSTHATSGNQGILTGVVRADATPISGMLVIIKDQTGKPVRLLKSNIEGKFGSRIALSPGIYEAYFEDPSGRYTVDPFRFEITTAPFVPWLINAKTKKRLD